MYSAFVASGLFAVLQTEDNLPVASSKLTLLAVVRHSQNIFEEVQVLVFVYISTALMGLELKMDCKIMRMLVVELLTSVNCHRQASCLPVFW